MDIINILAGCLFHSYIQSLTSNLANWLAPIGTTSALLAGRWHFEALPTFGAKQSVSEFIDHLHNLMV